jgi:acyl-CoA thioester hydrolase
MAEFRFYCPIDVRYGDIDAQGHVNTASYLTYFEQARTAYLHHLGLWDKKFFLDVGIIVASVRVSFFAPVRLDQTIRVGVGVTRLGRKSFDMAYSLEEVPTSKELAYGESVLVAYDYENRSSIPIPEVWRHAISTFEGIAPLVEAP